jgi:bacteriophage N4 adsorption protein B
MGWRAHPLELWMRLRDRRGPMTAIVLACAYLLIALFPFLLTARLMGFHEPEPIGPALRALLLINFAALLWRAGARALFTAREYGLAEGGMAILRMPLANVIAIMAGRRAIGAYLASLRTGRVTWDHTVHIGHPALAAVG